MNPIFLREWRARWREARSFWLLLVLSLVLALITGWVYSTTANYVAYKATYNPVQMRMEYAPIIETNAGRAARTGRALFQALALGNCLVYLCLAPALAAPGIARERERGLLESLQLSQMRPTTQILARYFSAVAFLLVLQLCTLPMYGVVLTIGGVSIEEMRIASFVIGLTILWGAALGLWLSARSYRPSNALFGAVGGMVAWSGISWFLGMMSTVTWPPTFFLWLNQALFFVSALHPGVLVELFINPNYFWGMAGGRGVTTPLTAEVQQALKITTAFYLLSIPLLLWSAIRKVNVSLPPAEWRRRNRWIEKRKAYLAQRRAQAKARRERAKLGEYAQSALIADLPLEWLVRFRDPLLAREVRGRFRLRKGSIGISLMRFVAFIIGGGVWVIVLFDILDPLSRARSSSREMVLYTVWGLGVAAVSALAATSFAREKESGTWEGLRLALLRPHEIVRSKWLSVLISYAYYTAPLWIMLPIAVMRIDSSLRFGALFYTLFGVAVTAASLGAFCAFGLWVSWRSPQPTAALTWTMGIAFTLLVAVPVIENLTDLEKQVSFARFGVAPSNSYSPDNEAREQTNWMKATGRLQTNATLYAPSFGNTTVNENWGQFEQWRQEQKAQARNFWLWLNVWQPWQALESVNRTGAAQTNEAIVGTISPYSPQIALLHLLFDLGASLLFLGLVRREVAAQRE